MEGRPCLAGNQALMEERQVDVSPLAAQAKALAQQGKTLLYVAEDGALLGLMACADVVKPRPLGRSWVWRRSTRGSCPRIRPGSWRN